jgi:hypothetical protein
VIELGGINLRLLGWAGEKVKKRRQAAGATISICDFGRIIEFVGLAGAG